MNKKIHLCILAERAEFDIKCYKILINKILQVYFPNLDVEYISPDYNIRPKGKLIKQLSLTIDLLYDRYSSLDFFIIFIDCDNLTPAQQRRELSKEMKCVGNFPQDKIILGLPKRNIESWFLGDMKNINRLLVKQKQNEFVDTEQIEDPKSEFTKIWKLTDQKEKIGTFALKVVENIDINILCNKSKTFKKFFEELKNSTVNLGQ